MADIYSILSGKGRGDDKHLRMVDGKISHVNEVEKDAIDVYGLLGEIFTKNVGTGDTNPNTGLPEYDYKEVFDFFKQKMRRKKSSASPHNASHDKFKQTGGAQGKDPKGHRTGAELNIERQQAQTTAEGADLLESDETAGQLNLGQTVLKAEDYKGMSPDAIVNDIFQKQYLNQVPPDMDMDETQFKQHLAGLLQNMPQFGEADPTKVGFAGEAKELAGRTAESSWDATKHGLQGQTGKIGDMLQSGYTGSGVGIRGSIGAQNLISQGFGAGLESRDIALDTADLGYREGVYGLEQQADADWETGFASFLGTLPSAA